MDDMASENVNQRIPGLDDLLSYGRSMNPFVLLDIVNAALADLRTAGPLPAEREQVLKGVSNDLHRASCIIRLIANVAGEEVTMEPVLLAETLRAAEKLVLDAESKVDEIRGFAAMLSD